MADYVDRMLQKAEKGKLGGTLRESRPEGKPIPRPDSKKGMLQMMYEMGKKSDAPKTKSYAPPGMANQVKGDLEKATDYEIRHAFPHNIKKIGETGGSAAYLPYRKPASANDSGGTSGGHA